MPFMTWLMSLRPGRVTQQDPVPGTRPARAEEPRAEDGMKARRQRVGLILVGLEPSIVPAFEYLLTHINVVQSSIDFEIVRPDGDDPLLLYLTGAGRLDREHAKGLMRGYPARLAAFLAREIEEYKIKDPPPDRFVIVSMARFIDEYYSSHVEGVGLLAFGDWGTEMAPPSLLEFVLVVVLRRAAAFIAPSLNGSLHMGTKGCLFDFNLMLTDVRLKVLNGHICDECERRIRQDGKPALIGDLQFVLRKSWLGAMDDRTSPAAICRKLGYDLFLTKGIKPSWRESLISTLQTDTLKEVLKMVPALIVALAVAYLMVTLGLKAG